MEEGVYVWKDAVLRTAHSTMVFSLHFDLCQSLYEPSSAAKGIFSDED